MDLEQRLARLERANRRMKRLGTVVLVVAAAVLLSGAAQGKELQHLEVGSLALMDKAGKVRATLAEEDGAVALAFYGRDGRRRAVLSMHADGSPGLLLYDKNGKPRAVLSVFENSAALLLFDKDGKTRATLGVDADGREVGLRLYDKAAEPRAVLGATTTGAKTRTAESALTLFDAKGEVIWQAPR